MNRALALLALLVFVAAGPQLLVEIQYEQDGDARIVDYQRQTGEDATRTSGQWTLELQDAQGLAVSQTRYDPRMILPSGQTSYLSSVHVPINAPASARSIAVIDPDGETVSAYEISGECGDLRCDANERNTCPQDCTQQAQQATQGTLVAPLQETDEGRGVGFWLGIGTAGLLIIVLVFVLIHINRNKENPIQTEY